MITTDYFQYHFPPVTKKRWVVGLSGGLDSMVLLHLCVQYRDRCQPSLVIQAIHVNHGLSSEADSWQMFCQQYCQTCGVELHTAKVMVQPGARQSLEQVAREKRYQVFRAHCRADDLLLLAHHRDDQVETLLYRLMRGTGISGLRAMRDLTYHRSKSARLAIWRPMLTVCRSEILAYGQHQGLSWIEDPSNLDDGFDRNFIRRQLVPLLEQRWPSFRKTLARVTRHAAEAHELTTALAALDIVAMDRQDHLLVAPFAALSLARTKNLVRYWLDRQGANLPSEKVLQQIVSAIETYDAEQNTHISWGADATVTHARWSVRSYQAAIWLVPDEGPFEEGYRCRLPMLGSVSLPSGVGEVSVEQGDAYCAQSDIEGVCIKRHDALSSWLLKFRQGGEYFRPVGRKQKLLKKWLQDWQCPPWQRHCVPLIYSNDELIAVAGYGVAEGWQPAEGQPYIRLIWRRASD
ncbi:MAG: tRNA lysidine(34) synthetase TilS [Pseudomonadales bacterium]|nr:tRNA lysidine(34) synthetase TilS [Pseudomonadales bacterium]